MSNVKNIKTDYEKRDYVKKYKKPGKQTMVSTTIRVPEGMLKKLGEYAAELCESRNSIIIREIRNLLVWAEKMEPIEKRKDTKCAD